MVALPTYPAKFPFPKLGTTAFMVNAGALPHSLPTVPSQTPKSLAPYCPLIVAVPEHVTYRFITINKEKISYSEGEILKLKEYSASVDLIISDIKVNINPELSTKIGIEGFSYSSMIGPLIDLVTFSTLLRSRLYNEISKDITVLSPMSLKLEACKLTYPAINIGKKKEKLEWRNKLGIAGGSFNKTDMYYSIIENPNFNNPYALFLKNIKNQIEQGKSIPKPLEDCNDAYLLYLYLIKHNEK